VADEHNPEPDQRHHPSLDDRFDPGYHVVDYDPRWPQLAEAEAKRVRGVLGSLAVTVEHVGSTAVPGLAAKPIIDLQVAVTALEPLGAFARPLEQLGYAFIFDEGSPDYLFFALPAERPRSNHLHVCEAGSDQERRHLAVRDYLRSHADEAQAYGELKRRLSASMPNDRLSYIAGKDAFVQALQQRALRWRSGG
jgi:GrpB-like predicted nucleotidyltransferase (UPF0157 family)